MWPHRCRGASYPSDVRIPDRRRARVATGMERRDELVVQASREWVKTSEDRPVIGLFDSGWGGLSIAGAVRRAVPCADLVYVGDHAWCPYGGRDETTIVARALALTDWLSDRGAKIVVIACNTASALALAEIRSKYPELTIVGVVPAVKPAAELSRTRRIAVLATPATAASDYLADLIRVHADGVAMEVVAAPGLVELVERGWTHGPVAAAAIRDVLGGPLASGVDVIVLGCTHFPFLRGAIEACAGRDVAVIDSGHAIGTRVSGLVAAAGTRCDRNRGGSLRLFTTGASSEASRIAVQLLGDELPVEPSDLVVQPCDR